MILKAGSWPEAFEEMLQGKKKKEQDMMDKGTYHSQQSP